MGHRCYVLLRRRHDVPSRRRWEFHLGRTCDVAGTFREMSLRRCRDILLSGGKTVLLIVEKGIRDGVCYSIKKYIKANNKYMNDYNKNKESSYLKFWDVNTLCGWAMSQKLPVNDFKWVGDISGFNESFIKSYNEENNEGYFLKVDIQYLENFRNLHDRHFNLKELKLKK